jgi:hypothetical protein
VDDLAVHNGEHGFYAADTLVGYPRGIKIIAAQDDEIAELAGLDRT